MNKMLRIAEVAYIVIFLISTVEVILMLNDGVEGSRLWIFIGFSALSLAMFFIRRKQRKRMEQIREQAEKEEEEESQSQS